MAEVQVLDRKVVPLDLSAFQGPAALPVPAMAARDFVPVASVAPVLHARNVKAERLETKRRRKEQEREQSERMRAGREGRRALFSFD